MPRPYDDDRLARLLAMLRPAPAAWILRAQQIPLQATTLTDNDVAELSRKLESDPTFRQRFDRDPVGATAEAGLGELSSQLQRELAGLVALAEQIARDNAYRAELADDPLTVLAASGYDDVTAEPLLRTLDVGDEVLARLPDVVAHQRRRASLRSKLLDLLLDSSAVGEKLRGTTR
jgi:hypothetical protein